MRGRININTDDVWSGGAYPMNQAVVEPDGRRLHLTGQVAWDADGNILHPGDAAGQTRAALENIRRVLAGAGGTLDDIVSLTTYFVRDEDKAAISAVRSEYLKPAFGPAATGVRVAGLWADDLLVELTVVAVIPHDRFSAPEKPEATR